MFKKLLLALWLLLVPEAAFAQLLVQPATTNQPNFGELVSTGTFALTNTAVSVKATSGNLFGVECFNASAAVAYIQIFNTASGSVVLGTTTPIESYGIPAGADFVYESPFGISYTTAISVAATTTYNGSTAPATALVCNFHYR